MQGLVWILTCSVVGHADGLVVGLRDARLIDQKIDDEVDVIAAEAVVSGRNTPTESTSRVRASSNPSATADFPVKPRRMRCIRCDSQSDVIFQLP